MPYSYIERQRIHRKAKAKLGQLKRDAEDHAIFMQQCIDGITSESDGALDISDAEIICTLLWEESDLY